MINKVRYMPVIFIIVGTTAGQLSLYSFGEEKLLENTIENKDITLQWSIIAHEPSDQPFDENFGSL